MKQLWGAALGGQQANAPSFLSKCVFPLGPFFSPSALVVLLPLEELVDESGPSLQAAGRKACLFFALLKSVRKRGTVINQASGRQMDWMGTATGVAS